MKTTFTSRFVERFLIALTILFASFTVLSVIIIFSAKFDFFTIQQNNLTFIYILHYFAIIIIELFYVFAFQLFLHPTSGFGFHFRFLFFSLAILFGICFLLQRFLIPQIILSFAFFQYIFTAMLFKGFLKHDNFEQTCENKAGIELKTELAKDKYIAQDFVQNISTVQTLLLVMALIFAALIVICQIALKTIPVLSYFFAAFYIISACSLLQLLSIYEKEIFYAFLGFDQVFNYRFRIFFFTLIFLLVCLIAGFIFSSNQAVLKKEYFMWFFNLFHKEKAPVEKPKIVPVSPSNFPSEPAIGLGKLDIEDKKSSPLAEIIVRILQFLALGTLLITLAIYLFKPIASKEVSKSIKNKKIREFFKRFFDELKDMFRKLLGLKIGLENYASVSSREFKIQMNDLIGKSKKSKEKKIELDRLTRQFMQIINWGENAGIKYKKSQAPAEYTSILFSKTQINALNETGYIFEKALYSKELLSKQEEMKYKENVENIINSKINFYD